MASVFRHKHSKYWQASFKAWRKVDGHVDGGKWVWLSRSTGIPLEEPKHVAETIATKFEAAGKELSPQGSNGGRISRAFYKKVIDDLCAIAGVTDEVRVPSFDEMAESWLEDRQIKDSSKQLYRVKIGLVSKYLQEKGITRLDQVTHEVGRVLYNDMLAHSSHTTAIGKVNILKMVIDRAVGLGVLTSNPLKLMRLRGAEVSPRKPFTQPEIRQILNYLESSDRPVDKQWLFASLLGLYYGMRISDATGLMEENLQGSLIVFVPQKKSRHGKAVRLPLLPQVRAAIPYDQSRNGKLTPDIDSLAHRNMPSNYIKLLEDRIGIEVPRSKAKNNIAHKSFHSWRKTNASLLANAGVDKRIAMLVADHDDPKVHDNYTELEIDRIREALNVIQISG